jgi:hypothetical protein
MTVAIVVLLFTRFKNNNCINHHFHTVSARSNFGILDYLNTQMNDYPPLSSEDEKLFELLKAIQDKMN